MRTPEGVRWEICCKYKYSHHYNRPLSLGWGDLPAWLLCFGKFVPMGMGQPHMASNEGKRQLCLSLVSTVLCAISSKLREVRRQEEPKCPQS